MRLIEIGMAVVFIGMVLIIIGSIIGSFLHKPSDGKTKVAVGGLIGPIPFGFANDRPMLWIVFGIIAIFMIIQIIIWSVLR
jgi:uncharacterized membrane protein